MRILFLQKRLVLPANTGGKIRTLNVLRHLAQWHEITYLSNLLKEERESLDDMRQLGLQMDSIPWHESPRRSIRFAAAAMANLVSPNPLNVDKDFDPRLRSRAEELIRTQPFDLVICDFVQMARNAIGLSPRSILFQHNVEAEVFARQSQRCRGPMQWYLRHQASKMRRFEGEAGRQFSRVVAVSDRDKRQFESLYGWDHVSVIDTAVNTEHFRPVATERSESGHVVFVGSMDWPPNVDGVVHFARRIWPLVRQQHPAGRFTVVGRNPPAAIRALSGQGGVEVTGSVPDTRPYLAQASVGIVPLYAGGGTRLKIFEMMASNRAVVSTSLGAEGLGLADGRELLIRDDDDGFAEGVASLLKDAARRDALARCALARVVEQHSSQAVARQFDQICHEVAETS